MDDFPETVGMSCHPNWRTRTKMIFQSCRYTYHQADIIYYDIYYDYDILHLINPTLGSPPQWCECWFIFTPWIRLFAIGFINHSVSWELCSATERYRKRGPHIAMASPDPIRLDVAIEIVEIFPWKMVDLSSSLCKRLPGRGIWKHILISIG